jgi:hypothetical protein
VALPTETDVSPLPALPSPKPCLTPDMKGTYQQPKMTLAASQKERSASSMTYCIALSSGWYGMKFWKECLGRPVLGDENLEGIATQQLSRLPRVVIFLLLQGVGRGSGEHRSILGSSGSGMPAKRTQCCLLSRIGVANHRVCENGGTRYRQRQ